MSDLDAADPTGARPSVFLSYASEDRAAARALRDGMQTLGLEVWYDESELGGGEAWDQKIRRQIRECDYFMALISATTEARHEGYFRREWRLAVERTLDMADDHLFLLPIVIDRTDQAIARVPEKFLSVQWLKVPGGQPTAALEALCRRIATGATPIAPSAVRKPRERLEPVRSESPAGNDAPVRAAASAQDPSPAPAGATAAQDMGAAFPRQEPGQKVRFWFEVMGWAINRTWIQFKRLPRWIRIVVYVWAAIALMSRCESSSDQASTDIPPAKLERLKGIAEGYKGSTDKKDIAKLGLQIAKEFADEAGVPTVARSPLLAIPFIAPAGDAAAAKLADSSFAMTYGMLARSRHGQVGLAEDPQPVHDLPAALERAKVNQSAYVLFGTVGGSGKLRGLTVEIAQVSDGALVWSKTYPLADAKPADIAAEVEDNLPSLDAAAPAAAPSPPPPPPAVEVK